MELYMVPSVNSSVSTHEGFAFPAYIHPYTQPNDMSPTWAKNPIFGSPMLKISPLKLKINALNG